MEENISDKELSSLGIGFIQSECPYTSYIIITEKCKN